MINNLNEIKDILEPKNQLRLYGFDVLFDNFVKLFKENKLPSVILLHGDKGVGKATFIYHFINYLLSKNQDYQYSLNNKFIDFKNKSYNLLNSNINTNFYLLEKNKDSKHIGIDEVRSLSSFLNKSSLEKNIKIVLVDNIENLNLNSSNALLKTLEDVKDNTFFFLTSNNILKVPITIKSRSIEFKIYFSYEKKREIFINLLKNYNSNLPSEYVLNFLHFDSPGNLLKYYYFLNDADENNNIKNILFFIDKYLKEKKLDDLNFVSLFIEKFYNDLIEKSSSNNFAIFFNRLKILNRINLMRKFNLDAKDTFFYVKNILKNDQR